MPDLSPDDKQYVSQALLAWRYFDHKFSTNGSPTEKSEARACIALRIAKAIGCRDEYLALVFAHPILMVTAREYDEDNTMKMFAGDVPVRRKGKRKKP